MVTINCKFAIKRSIVILQIWFGFRVRFEWMGFIVYTSYRTIYSNRLILQVVIS
jgi:hypothetical protein